METSPRTRAALAEAVLAYVEGAAGSRQALLAGARVPGIGLAEPRRMLDVGAIASLLEGAARMLDDPAVGLHFAADFEFGALGPFSYAVLHAPTLGTALRNVERYGESVAVGARLRVEVDGGTVTLHLPVWPGESTAFRQLDEAAVLFFLRMLRRLAGSAWSPLDVGFRHGAPADVREHRRLLGTAVRFDQPSNRIRFPAADLDRPVRDADRFLLPIVERELQDVVSEHAGPDPWRHALEVCVARHVCDGHPAIRTIAPELGVSVRTLQRRLDERGLSYRRLVADVRMQIARHYLQASEPSLGEIAFLLGYSELSAFDRAFRRWTGSSPGAYRRGGGAAPLSRFAPPIRRSAPAGPPSRPSRGTRP